MIANSYVSFPCCCVAMVFFVILDTVYARRIKRCHGIPFLSIAILMQLNAVLFLSLAYSSTPHIHHANAIDMLQKCHTYTLYIAGLKFA